MGKAKEEVAVYCTDVQELINRIKQSRSYTSDDGIVVKLGIDGGGGFFKITLSVLSKNLEQLTGNAFKVGGVKRLFIIALVQNLAEKYENVAPIWTKLLKLQNIEAIIAGDLKIINIITGIMAHSSRQPCPYCEAQKSALGTCKGTSRTKGNIKTNYLNKKMGGRNTACCIYEPLIYGNDDDEILFLCPPPPLHLTLGIVNTIFKGVEKNSPDWADLWVSQANVRHQQKTYGFTGRACHALLKAADCLELNSDLLGYAKVSYLRKKVRDFNNYLFIYQALKKFNDVYNKCFSFKLDASFEESIHEFVSSWEDLQLPNTSKYHITKHHVPDFCKATGRGLGLHNEQASESVHSDFDVVWQRYKAPKTAEVYNDRLLNAVIDYNSNHLF